MNLYDALAAKYAHPEWLLLREVRNARGFKATRSVDAVAIPLWESRGSDVLGFEVKASRSDWLRELKDPAKAEETSAPFNQWWVVAANETIVKIEEVPPSWGLLVLGSKGFSTVKLAIRRAAIRNEAFWMLACRRAADAIADSVPRRDVDVDARKLSDEMICAMKESHAKELNRIRAASDGAMNQVSAIRQALGAGYDSLDGLTSKLQRFAKFERAIFDADPELLERKAVALTNAAQAIRDCYAHHDKDTHNHEGSE